MKVVEFLAEAPHRQRGVGVYAPAVDPIEIKPVASRALDNRAAAGRRHAMRASILRRRRAAKCRWLLFPPVELGVRHCRPRPWRSAPRAERAAAAARPTLAAN